MACGRGDAVYGAWPSTQAALAPPASVLAGMPPATAAPGHRARPPRQAYAGLSTRARPRLIGDTARVRRNRTDAGDVLAVIGRQRAQLLAGSRRHAGSGSPTP